jgi:AraC family transcriptional regulator
MALQIKPERFETGKPMIIAGLKGIYLRGNMSGVPRQWQSFQRHMGRVPNQAGRDAFGIVVKMSHDRTTEYLTGVEVTEIVGIPPELTWVRLPEQRYVVFRHKGNVADVRSTFDRIWNEWLPVAGVPVANAPFFERYGIEFNPQTGNGGFEIWIPINEPAAPAADVPNP